MQAAWSIRVGLKVLFSLKLDDSARAFETIVFFSRPKDSFMYTYFIIFKAA